MPAPTSTPRPRLGPSRLLVLVLVATLPALPSAIASWRQAHRAPDVEAERVPLHTEEATVLHGGVGNDRSRTGPALLSTGGLFHPPDGDRGWADTPESAVPGYAVVLTNEPTSPALLDRLDATGLERLQYFPDRAWLVEVPDTEVADRIAAADAIRWFGAFPSELKLHFAVREALTQDPLELQLDVAPFGSRDIDQARLVDALEALAITIVWESPSAIRVFADPGQVRALTLESSVLHVAPAWDTPTTHHSRSMPVIYADRARVSINPALGQGVDVGIADSGYQRDHESLPPVAEARGYATEPNGCGGSSILDPFDDQRGHGTHVAGTTFGRGAGLASGHRGVAPSVQEIYIARIIDQSGFVTGDHLAGLRWQADVADVSNNSWGCCSELPCTNVSHRGTGTNAREMDRLAHDEGTIWVVSAGNDGDWVCPAASMPTDPCGGLTQDTRLGSPGDAKNVVTVGASRTGADGAFAGADCDVAGQRNITLAEIDTVSTFSGRGPTADARNKPDLVAPGEFICSADSGDLDGYVGWNGTSMAAPHVTGAVALLLDAVELDGDGATSSLRGRPDAVKAMLRASAAQVAPNLPDRSFGGGRLDVMRLATDRDASDGWVRGVTLGPALVTGDRAIVNLTLPTDADSITAVLSWTEPAAAAGACRSAQHDLDLRLRDPNGVVRALSRSANDTVETVSMTWNPATQIGPVPGTWQLEVDAWAVNGAPQEFAIAWVIDRGPVPGVPTVGLTCNTATATVGDTVTCSVTATGDTGITRGFTVRPRTSFFEYLTTGYRWWLRDGAALTRAIGGLFPPAVVLGELEPAENRTLDFDILLTGAGTTRVRVEPRWDGWSVADHGTDVAFNPWFDIVVAGSGS